FADQLLCGDKTMRAVMNGATEIDLIHPATPDPVTGNAIKISYANRLEGILSLGIYDILGNEVARPLDGVAQGAGSWQVVCDVSHLPSGQYTYRLSEGRTVISKQFVIQR
ncbi:MAG: T9SS type A sorting domain-containing protein, partial [Bacteroidota bacterium]|nr:T9SS type A sorting domain-containing protein [Bacteroidota bacterium]